MRRVVWVAPFLLIAGFAFLLRRPAVFDILSVPHIGESGQWSSVELNRRSIGTHFIGNHTLLVDYFDHYNSRIVETVDLKVGTRVRRPDLEASLNQPAAITNECNTVSPDGKYALISNSLEEFLFISIATGKFEHIPAIRKDAHKSFLWLPDSSGWLEIYRGTHDIPSVWFRSLRTLNRPEYRGTIEIGMGQQESSRAISDHQLLSTFPVYSLDHNYNPAQSILQGNLTGSLSQTSRVEVSLPIEGRQSRITTSPDRQKLAWLIWRYHSSHKGRWFDMLLGRGRQETGTVDIVVTDFRGQNPRILSRTPFFVSALVRSLTWSPDGNTLLVQCSDGFRTLGVPVY